MKKISISCLAFILLLTSVTACSDKRKGLQEKFDKLVLVAEQINVAIDSELDSVTAYIKTKPNVGSNKATITKLQDLIDDYETLKIDIPKNQEYSKEELEKLIKELIELINQIDESLLEKLDIDKNDIEKIKEIIYNKDVFDSLFTDDCTIKVKHAKITEQRKAVSDAVEKEEARLAKKAKDKAAKAAAEALKKKKATCKKNGGWWENGKCEYGGYAKPVLYLYPEKPTKVKVTFTKPEALTVTYPKFVDAWEVTAYPNGDLYDKSGKYYYALYWEEELNKEVDFSTGFYVEDKDAIKFLEEKLSLIGLNERERNEFIMYWLPILEANGKNLVYFELTQERELGNRLIITPAPTSLLRVAIHVKKVNSKTAIKEEKLTRFERKGFVAVEWGGVLYR